MREVFSCWLLLLRLQTDKQSIMYSLSPGISPASRFSSCLTPSTLCQNNASLSEVWPQACFPQNNAALILTQHFQTFERTVILWYVGPEKNFASSVTVGCLVDWQNNKLQSSNTLQYINWIWSEIVYLCRHPCSPVIHGEPSRKKKYKLYLSKSPWAADPLSLQTESHLFWSVLLTNPLLHLWPLSIPFFPVSFQPSYHSSASGVWVWLSQD